jgi:two-component system, chemotaxis family, chemotaxis protein CheY
MMSEAKKKVLICDDTFNYRKLQKEMLQKHFQPELILQAGKAEEVFDILEHEGRVDLIMMDINLPGMDGIEAVAKVRAIQQYADIPIVMCSTLNDRQKIMRALKAGANDYIVKPFEEEAYISKVQKFF